MDGVTLGIQNLFLMKYFNSQRCNILEGNRFTKYLSYAFGEVLLVVIGILIALGINNWNEENKADKETIALKSRVLRQVDSDIKIIEHFQKDLDTLQEEYLSVLDKTYDKTMVRTGSIIASLLIQVNTLDVDNSVISMIDGVDLKDNQIARELVDTSGLYKLYLSDIEGIGKIIISTTNNLKEIEKTESWYADFITDFACRNECIKYLLSNSDHKAGMASLRFLYLNGYGGIRDNFLSDLKNPAKELAEINLNS